MFGLQLSRRAHSLSRRQSKPASRIRQAVLDTLEERTLFSAVFPTASEQYLVELINRARANPTAEVQRLASDPSWAGTPDLNEGVPAGTLSGDAVQPVAINPFITDAARKHAVYMIDGPLSHDEPTPGLESPTARAITAGYVAPTPPPTFYVGENIFYTAGISDETQAMDLGESNLFIDNNETGTAPVSPASRGHRLQMLNGLAKLIGVGVASGGGFITLTEDFTNVNNSQAFLTGVAFNDTDSNNFYTPGEGLGNVTITATRISDGQVFTTTTWDAGGYTLALADGAYTVVASGGGIGTPAPRTVTVSGKNVKVDFNPAASPPPPPTASGPTILQQPANVTSRSSSVTQFVGAPVTFTTAASGTPTPTYQWQLSVAGGGFTNIAGATNAVYTFTPAGTDSGNQYRCVVTNTGGSVNTSAATLTLTGVGTFITKKPQDQTVNVGDTITLTSAATGLNPAIIWSSLQTGTGQDYAAISGATSPNYTFAVTPDMAGKVFFYRVVYTNTQNTAFTDQGVAVITVNANAVAPTITAQPQAVNATDGGTATLTTAATAFPTSTIQWQVLQTGNTPGFARPTASGSDNFVNVNGLTGASVSLPVSASMNGAVYRAVITNSEGTVVTNPIKLSVNNKSVIVNELKNLAREAKAALKAIDDCGKVVSRDAKTLSADLKRLHASKEDRALVAKLKADDAANRKVLKRNQSRLLKALQHDAKTLESLRAALAKHPGDADLTAKLQTALTTLQADVDSNTVPQDATECHLGVLGNLTPLTAVSPNDGKLQGDIATASSHSDAIGQALQAPNTIALQIIARIQSAAS